MGNRKDPEKAPEIPHSGALKKLFELIVDANFPYNANDVNSGRKYRIQQRIGIPRQWYLELYKLPKDSGFGLRVAVNGAIPPATDPAFAILTNVSVTDVKLNDSNIFVWVENSSGSVANLIFNLDEDKFQARLFTNSIVEHDEALKEVHEAPFLDSLDIRDLNGDSRKVTRVLKGILSLLHQVNKQCIEKASKVEATKARKRNVGIAAVVTAPSRDIFKGKGKTPEVGTSRDNARVALGGAVQGAVIVHTDQVDGISNGQLPTGIISLDPLEAETPIAKKTKRMKVSPKNQRGTIGKIPTAYSVETKQTLEMEICKASLGEEEPSAIPSKKKKEYIYQHPCKTVDGKEIDFEDHQEELKQFKNRVKPIFPFGPETLKMVSVENMDLAPSNLKYRPYHDSLAKSLLEIFLTAIHPQKQTLTLMPNCDVKPKSYDKVKDGKFYIINGQHSWAAAKMLIDSPYIPEEQKNEYKTWKCDFVWTKNLLLLSELSLRINNTNKHRWNSPEYLLHIQYARDLWIKYGKPQPKGVDSKKYKDFQKKAVETLNSMSEKNASKTSAEYQGEFRVICADNEFYDQIMNAFKWYESGDLINPDTGNKWQDESEAFEGKEWTRKFTVAYTFKCVRSLSKASLVELVQKITLGLTNSGQLMAGPKQYPKVYMAANKPKKKYAVSLKEWTDRKKTKNGVVRWLNRRYHKELWSGEDINAVNWKTFKKEVGFTSAHMDELIWRATKKYLSKFMKASDKPRREQNPPPDAFLAEIERVLSNKSEEDISLALVLGYLQNDGSISDFAQERIENDNPNLPAPQQEDTLLDCFNPWVLATVTDMPFVGGVMDMRLLDSYIEELDNCPSYISILLSFSNILTLPPYWMVITHSNKSEDVLQALQHYFPDWDLSECKYVPTASEKYFFSTSTLKLGNGVVIFLLGKNSCRPLYLGKQIISEERHKKIGEVREFILELYNHELRMEVYLDFVNQARSQESPEQATNFLFIAAGRKPMIAAVMSGMRPVALVIDDRAISTGDYLKSYKVGCQLQGFKHLFDTAFETDNTVGSDVWPQQSGSTIVACSEVRKKMKEEQGAAIDGLIDELEESSENNTEESGTDEEQEENVETFELQGSHPPLPNTYSPMTPSPLVDPKLVTLTEYQCCGLQKQAEKGSFSSSYRKKLLGLLDASPVEQMYKKSAFAQSTVDPSDLLEDVDLEQPSNMDFLTPNPTLPAPIVNCSLTLEDVDMVTQVAEAISSPHIARLTPKLVIPLMQVVPKEEPAVLCTPHMESNKEDPIVIDSDEEDHILSAVRERLPSDEESELSEGPTEEPTDQSSEHKVSAQKALRIQLKGISKGKLSINRANLLKSRELEIQNMKLLQELATERKLRELANERLRSCGLGLIPTSTSDSPSPSAGQSHQATTSIASTPEISLSEADLATNPPRHASDDFIAGTQESAFKKQATTLKTPEPREN